MDLENKLKQSLTENTYEVFDKVSRLQCIKDMYLCGGTAQSLQMQHRKSEDLDFEIIGISKDRPELQIAQIISEIKQEFPEARTNIMGDNHFEVYVGKEVKLSFFRPDNPVPYINQGLTYNNLKTPSLQDLLGMKIFTTSVRLKFRDYYDIYCLVKKGYNISEGIRYASKFSRHNIKSKDLYSNLITSTLYQPDANFKLLDPICNVTPKEIENEIQRKMISEKAEELNNEKPKRNKIKPFKL